MATPRPDQRHTVPVTPPRDAIPGISRMHVQQLESTADDSAWNGSGMPYLILRTVGRKSGKEHKATLPFWIDENGHRIVVASFAGAPTHPAWYLNLTDAAANPEVEVHVQAGRYRCVPESLDGDDYARVWGELSTDRPFYADYQTRCERRIPLVRLPESAPPQ